ncbi:MAG: hypothetical protein Q4D82_04165 [Neisseria sp.]|nr:hypothetical protein [Neisseria sp.]
MKKLTIAALGVAVSAAAVAASTPQEVIKQAYVAESYSHLATPQFQKLIKQANRIADKVDPEMGCELFEHYNMGIGNGGAPDNIANNLKIKKIKPNVYRARYKGFDGKWTEGADFTVLCKNGSCKISDVGSAKAVYREIIKKRSCGY